MDLPLFRLYLRRAMHPGLGLVLLAVAGILYRSAEVSPAALLEVADPEQLARGMVRRDAWFALCAVLFPVLLVRAAHWAQVWQTREAGWLAVRRSSWSGIVVTSWAATLAGGALWLVAIAAVGELFAGGSGASLRPLASWSLESRGWSRGEELLRWEAELPGLPTGSRARARLGLIGDLGAVEELELVARRAEEPAEIRLGRTIPTRRARVEVELPPGEGPLLFELRAPGAGAPLLVEGASMEVFVPAAERAAAPELWLRITLTLAAALALAMGLGAWVSAPSAVALVGLCWCWVWLGGAAAPLWPGSDLPTALATLAEGRVPARLAGGSLAGAAVLVAVGLSLLRAGLVRGRGAR